MEETKHERFIRIATARTNKLLQRIEKLKNCAARSSYEYTPAEVEKIFTTVEAELAECKKAFTTAPKGKLIAFTLFDVAEENDG